MREKLLLILSVSLVFASIDSFAKSGNKYSQIVLVGEDHTAASTIEAHKEMVSLASKGRLKLLDEGLDASLNSDPAQIDSILRIDLNIAPAEKISNVYGIDSSAIKALEMVAFFLKAGNTDQATTRVERYQYLALVKSLKVIYDQHLIGIVGDPQFHEVWSLFANVPVADIIIEKFNAFTAERRVTFLRSAYNQLEEFVEPESRVSLATFYKYSDAEFKSYWNSRNAIRDEILARNIESFARNSEIPVIAMVGNIHGSGIVRYLTANFPEAAENLAPVSCDDLLVQAKQVFAAE